jgi:hypothetical protein
MPRLSSDLALLMSQKDHHEAIGKSTIPASQSGNGGSG